MKKLLVLLAGVAFFFVGTAVRADMTYEDPAPININSDPQVSEPGMLILFGSCLVVLGIFGAKKIQK